MKKIRNNLWGLILVFFGLPILITVMVVFGTNEFLESQLTERIMSVSGYLFTTSSLILVFVLYRSLKPSDYHKAVQEQRYLDKESIDELYFSLRKIKSCIRKDEIEGLADNCRNVVHIYLSLRDYEDDVILKAYQNHLKNLYNLINRNKLVSIGLQGDYEKLRKITKKNKNNIWIKADDLERYVKRMERR